MPMAQALLFCLVLLFFADAAHAKHLPQVDVVYTWVNGADPEWQKTRSLYAEQENNNHLGTDAQQSRRFRDNNELKYSLRALNTFAPWVHHIFIVTCGHKPAWLFDHPKISIISHKEIFADEKNLPTFNSMAIESHLHRIPGLQEHYIYFNDDVFLGHEASFSDFYTPSGKTKVFMSQREHPRGSPLPEDTGFIAACKNTSAVIYATTRNRPRFLHAHTPFPSRKSVTSFVERTFPGIFEIVSSHRFRSLQDYTITNGLIPFTAVFYGYAEKFEGTYVTCRYEGDPSHDEKILHQLLHDRPQFFCIQDGLDDDHATNTILLQNFFESYFPTPAPWEAPVKVETQKKTL